MKKKLLLIMLSTLCLSLYSQESVPPQKETIEQKQTNLRETLVYESNYTLIDKEQLIEIYNENQELKKENESIQKALEISNLAFDRATNGYFWILSIIIGIVAIFLGGNIIYQHFDRKAISKAITEEVLTQCREEIKILKQNNKAEIENRFETIRKKVESETATAIERIKEIQLKMLEEEFSRTDNIQSKMYTALNILSLHFDLNQNFDVYDGEIVSYIEYLIKCLKEGNTFWSWNVNTLNKLEQKCPLRIKSRFDVMKSMAQYDVSPKMD